MEFEEIRLVWSIGVDHVLNFILEQNLGLLFSVSACIIAMCIRNKPNYTDLSVSLFFSHTESNQKQPNLLKNPLLKYNEF